MIPYHGTPLGGRQIDKPLFLRGRHALIPFPNPDDIHIAAECCQSFVIDNGAFSAWNSGQPVTDWTPYREFVREWYSHPGFDWAIIPDVIDGSEADNDKQIIDWINWKGWNDGMTRGHICYLSVPVWHMHESIDRLIKLARGWRRVAFGSSGEFAKIGTRSWNDRMHEAWAAITVDGRPRCRVHGLRMMDAAVFHRFPFASVDSTNVAQNYAREAVKKRVSEAVAREFVAYRIEPHNSASHYVPGDQQTTLEFIKP